MRTSLAALIIGVLVAACGDSDPSLSLGTPTQFKLAPVPDTFDIGIDLEIRLPNGYRGFATRQKWGWFGRREPSPTVRVLTDPQEQATFELPCGPLREPSGVVRTVTSRTELPDGILVGCERKSYKTVLGFWVVRLLRTIDTVVECSVGWVDPPSAKQAAAGLAICGSLRVLGRSSYTQDDFMLTPP